MERDLAAELDSLKEEIQALKRAHFPRLPNIEPKVPGGNKDNLPVGSGATLNELRDQLLEFTESRNEPGAVAYAGTFRSGDEEAAQQSIWASFLPVKDLLSLNEQRMAEKVLTSVGNSQRLAILLALLKKPMTANQLVEALGSNTTGQVYHHLKPLVSADIVKEEKGIYCIVPYRVQGIVMLLAGVWDLIDPRYSTGTWEEQAGAPA